MHIFDVVLLHRWSHLAQVRNTAAELVNVGHCEVDATFFGRSEQVQDRVGRPAHCNIERHGVGEGQLVCNGSWQDRLVALFIVALRNFDDELSRLEKQPFAIGMGCKRGAVAGQRKPKCFGETVHGVGGEHARARSTCWTCRAFNVEHVFVAGVFVASDHHCVDEVDTNFFACEPGLASFHWSAGNKYDGDVQSHRRHEHARGDLVAVRNGHDRVGLMTVDHVLDRIGNELSARQAVEHAGVAHCNAIVDSDRVELFGNATCSFDLSCNELAHVLQVDVTGHELGEAIRHRNNWLVVEVLVGHAGRTPERTSARHIATTGRFVRAILSRRSFSHGLILGEGDPGRLGGLWFGLGDFRNHWLE